jgi:hypothetical protein
LGGARASLSRATGVAGTLLTLTGSHWPANASVQLYVQYNIGSPNLLFMEGVVDQTPFAEGTADASGNLNIAAFAAPQIGACISRDSNRPGLQQALIIARSSDGEAQIALPFTFYPTPGFSSSESSVQVLNEKSISLTGVQWEPGEAVTITPEIIRWPSSGVPDYSYSHFQPVPSIAYTVVAAADGSFTSMATLPQESPETQVSYIASGDGPRYGQVTEQLNQIFSILPSVLPTLKLSREAAQPGERITVTGEHWPANQDIRVAYCETNVVRDCEPGIGDDLARTRSTSDGLLHVTVTLSTNMTPGAYIIRVAPDQTPFDPSVYTVTMPFTTLYPFAQAHPLLETLINASPFVVALLLIGSLALADWLRRRRATRITTKTTEIA